MLHDPVSEANTPLTPEEQADLIPSLATREELNEWERDNILHARQWALGDRQLSRSDPTNEEYIHHLHARMFDQTWIRATSHHFSNSHAPDQMPSPKTSFA